MGGDSAEMFAKHGSRACRAVSMLAPSPEQCGWPLPSVGHVQVVEEAPACAHTCDGISDCTRACMCVCVYKCTGAFFPWRGLACERVHRAGLPWAGMGRSALWLGLSVEREHSNEACMHGVAGSPTCRQVRRVDKEAGRSTLTRVHTHMMAPRYATPHACCKAEECDVTCSEEHREQDKGDECQVCEQRMLHKRFDKSTAVLCAMVSGIHGPAMQPRL